MIIKDGIEYGIDNTTLTTLENKLVNQLQDKKITWNGEEKLLTTVLQEINSTASGKSNIIVIDALPTTLTKNSQYWVKSKADGSEPLTTGRHIYIVDAFGTATYVGKSEVNFDDYFQKANILTAKDTSADDTKVYSAKVVNENFFQNSNIKTAKDTSATDSQIYSAKYVNDKLLRTDGTNSMTADLNFESSTTDLLIKRNDSTGKHALVIKPAQSSTKSAYIKIFGANYPTSSVAGSFRCSATGSTTNYDLNGKSDGTLTWGSNNIAVDSSLVTTQADIVASVDDSNISIALINAYKLGKLAIVTIRIGFTAAKTYSNSGILNFVDKYKPSLAEANTRYPCIVETNKTTQPYCIKPNFGAFVYRYGSYKNLYFSGTVVAGEVIHLLAIYPAS